jgi:hypothetical protein
MGNWQMQMLHYRGNYNYPVDLWEEFARDSVPFQLDHR